MNNRMRHFVLKLMCEDAGCKDISELAGFAFYRHGQDEPVDPDDPDVPEVEPYGYVYDGNVLTKPVWDEAKYPYAAMDGYATLLLYVSANPIRGSESSYVYISPPYCTYSYDRETNQWVISQEVEEGTDRATTVGRLIWSNHNIMYEDSVVFEGTTPRAFYLNDPNTPTAFLYTGGKMVFQSNSTPDSDDTISAAYVDWKEKQYGTSGYTIPWRRIDKDAINRVTINADAIPVYTDYWFRQCSNLGSASLAEGLKKIGKSMFYQTKLAPINIPNTVEEIETYAYAELSAYDDFQTVYRKQIVIPDSCVKIGDYAFNDCHLDHNTIVTIGAGCKEIGRYAFGNNKDIKNVTIGASVTRIQPYAFYQCGASRVGISSINDAWCNFYFNNTQGWWVSQDGNATEGIAVDVSDPKAAGKLIAAYSNGNYDWDQPTVNGQYYNYYWNRGEPIPEPESSYLTFASANPFTIATGNATRNWKGTLYYSTDTRKWNVWYGSAIASAEHNGEQRIYMRGSGNDAITHAEWSSRWILSGSGIACRGNIETLLDYQMVVNGEHPSMADDCYRYLFYGCTSLAQAPALPATTLAYRCYYSMFEACTSLTQIPALPATMLADSCYIYMFYGCSSLKLSTDRNDEYSTPYQIPYDGVCQEVGVDSLTDMFTETGGTFTGTPSINTTYYTSNTVV